MKSNGAGAIMINAVALIPPTQKTTRARSAGYFHPEFRIANNVMPQIQPRPTHGKSKTEVRV
jgi:hypothetical protein